MQCTKTILLLLLLYNNYEVYTTILFYVHFPSLIQLLMSFGSPIIIMIITKPLKYNFSTADHTKLVIKIYSHSATYDYRMLPIKPLDMQLDQGRVNQRDILDCQMEWSIGPIDSEDFFFFKNKKGSLIFKKWVPAATLNENVGRS